MNVRSKVEWAAAVLILLLVTGVAIHEVVSFYIGPLQPNDPRNPPRTQLIRPTEAHHTRITSARPAGNPAAGPADTAQVEIYLCVEPEWPPQSTMTFADIAPDTLLPVMTGLPEPWTDLGNKFEDYLRTEMAGDEPHVDREALLGAAEGLDYGPLPDQDLAALLLLELRRQAADADWLQRLEAGEEDAERVVGGVRVGAEELISRGGTTAEYGRLYALWVAADSLNEGRSPETSTELALTVLAESSDDLVRLYAVRTLIETFRAEDLDATELLERIERLPLADLDPDTEVELSRLEAELAWTQGDLESAGVKASKAEERLPASSLSEEVQNWYRRDLQDARALLAGLGVAGLAVTWEERVTAAAWRCYFEGGSSWTGQFEGERAELGAAWNWSNLSPLQSCLDSEMESIPDTADAALRLLVVAEE